MRLTAPNEGKYEEDRRKECVVFLALPKGKEVDITRFRMLPPGEALIATREDNTVVMVENREGNQRLIDYVDDVEVEVDPAPVREPHSFKLVPWDSSLKPGPTGEVSKGEWLDVRRFYFAFQNASGTPTFYKDIKEIKTPSKEKLCEQSPRQSNSKVA